MSRLELEKHNRIRELILRIACQSYPNALDATLLRTTLANLSYPMDDPDLRFYLSFLKERGYLALDEKREFGIVLVTITASGIDALDGRIKDCAIGCGSM